MKDFILKNFIFKSRLSLLLKRKKLYEKTANVRDKLEYQINSFNTQWARICRESHFYQYWKEKYHLPDAISSIEDLKSFPILTKGDIQAHHTLVTNHGALAKYVSTGGSTGEPTKFPISHGLELDEQYSTSYLGRSWWGIDPLNKTCHFWGHSHLFGTGIKGKINYKKRLFLDYLINSKRFNAYDMRKEKLEEYFIQAKNYSPEIFIGYTSCIFKLAQFAKGKIQDGDFPALKGIILAAETVTEADIDLITEVFHVPVIIEYGMAETGVLAYSQNFPQHLSVFWDTSICTLRDETSEELIVTTITGKVFPLINYRTNDRVEVQESCRGSIFALKNIKGRMRETLNIQTINGKELAARGTLMVQVLKSYPGLLSIQFKQLENQKVKIFLNSHESLDLTKVQNHFLREIRKDHPDISSDAVFFEQIDSEMLTLAGKSQIVLR